MFQFNIPVRRSRSSGELRATLPELQSHLSGVENQSGITFSDWCRRVHAWKDHPYLSGSQSYRNRGQSDPVWHLLWSPLQSSHASQPERTGNRRWLMPYGAWSGWFPRVHSAVNLIKHLLDYQGVFLMWFPDHLYCSSAQVCDCLKAYYQPSFSKWTICCDVKHLGNICLI